MTATYKVLGQMVPTAINTYEDLYEGPPSGATIISTINICNRGATNATFRLVALPLGATLGNQHFLCYDLFLAGNDFLALTLGATLGSGDKIRVYSSTTNLSFSVFGTEIT